MLQSKSKFLKKGCLFYIFTKFQLLLVATLQVTVICLKTTLLSLMLHCHLPFFNFSFFNFPFFVKFIASWPVWVGRRSFKGPSLVQVLCLSCSIGNPFVKVSFSRSGISDNLIQWTSLSIPTSHTHTHTHTSSFPPFASSNLLGSLARLMVFFSLSRSRLLSSFLSFSLMKLELAIMALFDLKLFNLCLF